MVNANGDEHLALTRVPLVTAPNRLDAYLLQIDDNAGTHAIIPCTPVGSQNYIHAQNQRLRAPAPGTLRDVTLASYGP